MLDAEDRRVLAEIRTWEDPGPATWKHTWHNVVLVVGGIVLAVGSAIRTGGLVGAAGGFMLGVGVLALLVTVPVAKRLRTLSRLVRHADAKGAFADESPPLP